MFISKGIERMTLEQNSSWFAKMKKCFKVLSVEQSKTKCQYDRFVEMKMFRWMIDKTRKAKIKNEDIEDIPGIAPREENTRENS